MKLENPVFELAKELISRVSVTPEDAGCQELIAARLNQLGFQTRQINAEGVHNLWAWRGTGSPHLMFAGHTDVVPPGPLEQWQTPPFEPTVKNGQLYGRGAADMKSSLAAMIVAVEDATAQAEHNNGTLSFLITSDEEGVATYGTRHAIDVLAKEGIRPDYCVVGEPSSSEQLGDVVRSGRRGSLNAKLKVIGTQGHVAYPQDANNPIHNVLTALSAMTTKEWDLGNDFYPPTSFQISNINGGTGATNVIPGELEIDFNFRFNTEQTATGLSASVEEILHSYGVTYEIKWQLSGEPFLTLPGALTEAVTQAIKAETGLTTELSTSGGTSDGRFISPWDKPGSGQVEVVELGPLNATIHKIDECVAVDDLMPLARIYQQIIKTLLN
ncbi:succinyl-diaminopimelate desuccinylase [Pseudomonadales bacterium]|nr:succinyl-diaminopimelate desuccinylase [Pseudomonadales bacterium]MDA8703490.1 succinyl-diaminopimelate desuccinylase [Pseudomonadales bacterium]MDA8952506.1 succinyl-diaminopimelate desuccinylase [Pseudomonadales bacterium]MDB2595249.1 succinyl-diaminopimelate desuccinylase [Pseudomonadales bacterium]MDB9757053.1 succinyl-diaminopimelate desuccinylase [Pseudomonadales bacterium]